MSMLFQCGTLADLQGCSCYLASGSCQLPILPQSFRKVFADSCLPPNGIQRSLWNAPLISRHDSNPGSAIVPPFKNVFLPMPFESDPNLIQYPRNILT